MLKFLVLLLVVLGAAVNNQVQAADCADITAPCACVGKVITNILCDCTPVEPPNNQTLTELLTGIPKTTEILEFTKCNFDVTGTDLDEYASLKTLILGSNEIATIAKDAFSALVALNELDLHDNSITKLEDGTFSALKAIQELNLDNNLLTELKGVSFGKLPTLATLSVKNNPELATVNFTSAAFPNLKRLTLAKNKLTSLNKWCMGDSTKLKDLDASHNEITEVTADAFGKVISKTLTTVHLEYNQLTPELPAAFSTLVNLQYLDVSYNSLFWMYDSTLAWNKLDEVHLRNNSWECECRNAWLVDRKVVFKSHNDTYNSLICGSPLEVKGKSVFDKDVKELFKCPGHCGGNGTTAAGFGIGLIVGLLLAVICFVIYCRYSASKKRNSQYSHHINT